MLRVKPGEVSTTTGGGPARKSETDPERARGVAANIWGRQTARALAQQLGVTTTTLRNNVCLQDGKRSVIKCAAPTTRSVGVTVKLLDTLDVVIGAFQRPTGECDL